MVAGATGVQQRYYRTFAQYLAARRWAVLTFDYRGIGASRRGDLKGFAADFLDWAEKDLAAVVDWALARAPTAVVGHSFGGQAFGLLPRANDTLGLYTFGTGTGWYGHMSRRERPRVLLLWKVVGPLLTRLFGYLPGRRLGLGAGVPLGVYRQWRVWCGKPRHWFDDPSQDFAARFATVRGPVVAVNALDDAWVPPVQPRHSWPATPAHPCTCAPSIPPSWASAPSATWVTSARTCRTPCGPTSTGGSSAAGANL